MDEKDLQILSILQADARIGNAEISRRLGLAASAVFERIRKLVERGVLRGFHARVDAEAVGRGLLAFVSVQVDDRLTEHATGVQLARLPQVQEVHHIAGEDCYLIKVRCASTGDLGRFLQEEIGAFPAVRRTRTTVVLGTMKESLELPIPVPEPLAEAVATEVA
ncbi:MAG: Lrp/AsnC family transcriptional regulator [Thermoanaerobaculia bacterium]